MLEMIRGCSVPKAHKLCEQYERDGSIFTANVSAGHIREVLLHFVEMQTDPLCFFLEIPCTRDEEEKLRESSQSSLHKRVYYWDGITQHECRQLMDEYGEMLIHDGMDTFGFCVKGGAAEIGLGAYNVVTLITKTPERYETLFESHWIPRVKRCVTAWSTFSRFSPGDCFSILVDGKSVFDLPEILKEQGLYFHSYREA